MLALFFCSTWGLSSVNAQAVNEAQHAAAMAAALAREVAQLRRELARLAAIGEFGSANAPAFNADTPAQLLRRRPMLNGA
ncbi:hypothetical protein [Roseateles microcysteis]|uniref:hypothetical protein n=1 Tax=Roseateles microcysteis TaxID=3119057 RepID=UPI002FE65452